MNFHYRHRNRVFCVILRPAPGMLPFGVCWTSNAMHHYTRRSSPTRTRKYASNSRVLLLNFHAISVIVKHPHLDCLTALVTCDPHTTLHFTYTIPYFTIDIKNYTENSSIVGLFLLMQCFYSYFYTCCAKIHAVLGVGYLFNQKTRRIRELVERIGTNRGKRIAHREYFSIVNVQATGAIWNCVSTFFFQSVTQPKTAFSSSEIRSEAKFARLLTLNKSILIKSYWVRV